MSDKTRIHIGSGVSLGAPLAAVLSYTVNESIIWSILHFWCGWIYVFFYLIEYPEKVRVILERLGG